MLKNWSKIAATTLSMGVGVLFITTTSFASSKYVIKQTQTIPRTAYHITNSSETLFTWNKNHTKRLRIINQLDTKKQKMSWWADEKVEMEHNGKTSTYLHLESEYGSAGYVDAKAMTQGYSKGYSSDAAYFCYYQLNHTLSGKTKPIFKD